MLPIINSNLSHREAFRMYDSLPEDRIEALLDDSDKVESLSCIDTSEVAAQFPDEDFLYEPLRALLALKKNLRGDNRTRLEKVIAMLDDIQINVSRSSEYGLEELQKIEKTLNA